MPFSDVRHQDAAQRRIQLALRAGRVPHAYIFAGPSGIGKEMLATRLANLLICANPQSIPQPSDEPWLDACGTCEDCEMMAAGSHPDYQRIYRQLNKFHPDRSIQRRKAIDLGVDVVRHFLVDRVGTHPARARAKVFVVAEADRLSNGAQNAMLKTLEEPPEKSHLILLTTSPDALLATTRSRCQVVPFATLPTPFVIERIRAEREIAEPAARFVAEVAQGSIGTALRLIDLGLHDRAKELLAALPRSIVDPIGAGQALSSIAKGFADQIKAADADSDDEDDAVSTNATRDGQILVLTATAAILRDVQRLLVGVAPAAFTNPAAVERLIGPAATPESLRAAIRAVGDAEYQIGSNANANLIFDTVGIEIGRGLGQSAAA